MPRQSHGGESDCRLLVVFVGAGQQPSLDHRINHGEVRPAAGKFNLKADGCFARLGEGLGCHQNLVTLPSCLGHQLSFKLGVLGKCFRDGDGPSVGRHDVRALRLRLCGHWIVFPNQQARFHNERFGYCDPQHEFGRPGRGVGRNDGNFFLLRSGAFAEGELHQNVALFTRSVGFLVQRGGGAAAAGTDLQNRYIIGAGVFKMERGLGAVLVNGGWALNACGGPSQASCLHRRAKQTQQEHSEQREDGPGFNHTPDSQFIYHVTREKVERSTTIV